ncbi:alpha/beta fold hydrolase [Methylocystis sp. WRRC1]|uniref:alpha/beta hydrolase n=1 Tax=Methylocystis sp. WRRC1 TaxID=1732014 RepID=UPI001D143C94|nr:alpha/beta fold hydrolase [Methylocystis sp. WRRC1]MCC3245630.1 alpha/beta fold hydrolase [Methylocystis sp. WRRC1]
MVDRRAAAAEEHGLRIRNIIAVAACGPPLLYATAFIGLALQQRSILYHPGAAFMTPAQAGLAGAETLKLATEDGERLAAWYAAPRTARFPLIIYFHGNGGGLVDRGNRFRMLTMHGFGLLAISYRGYGGSTGTPTEEGLLQDANAAYAEARRRGFPPSRIVLMGESLGTGVATILASRHEAAALVLDSPYDSIVDAAAVRFPLFPVSLAVIDTFNAGEAIGKVRAPCFMAVGEADPITPVESARRLFARANEPKEIVEIPGGGHVPMSRPDVLARAIDWIDATVTATPARDPSQ